MVWAIVAIVLVAALVVWQAWSAYVRYRRTMNRPWPKVAPLPDEDDD